MNGLKLCTVVVLLFILTPAVTSNKGVSEAVEAKTVNHRAAIRLASPVPRAKPIQPTAVSRSNAAGISVKGLVKLFEISAYSPTAAECDGNPLRTATGKRVRVGGIAADIRVLPFGSLVIIPGYNNGKPCEVIDTGGAIRGLKLDVFLWSAHEAIHWGRRRNVPVTILRLGHGD